MTRSRHMYSYRVKAYFSVFYQIIVFTGQRNNAGTKSNVHFILSSDKDETSIRTLADSHRQILLGGGIDLFRF